ncbi:MAG TPA: hypothetical protein VHD32_00050 [Candidatus Didemnitutus sp.]|nr:hypothetical protein [Candidatus Didemnitutus sp.]
MSASKPNTRSPAERRAAEAELRELIFRFAPAHEQVMAAVRRHLRKRLPTAHELVYEYRDVAVISISPNEHGYEGILVLRAGAKGVELCFNRANELPDPTKLLQGSGKQVRSMPVEDASMLKRPEVARLIEEAIARNPVPFARAGRGAVVIRSTSAAQRRRAS